MKLSETVATALVTTETEAMRVRFADAPVGAVQKFLTLQEKVLVTSKEEGSRSWVVATARIAALEAMLNERRAHVGSAA